MIMQYLPRLKKVCDSCITLRSCISMAGNAMSATAGDSAGIFESLQTSSSHEAFKVVICVKRIMKARGVTKLLKCRISYLQVISVHSFLWLYVVALSFFFNFDFSCFFALRKLAPRIHPLQEGIRDCNCLFT